MTEEEAIAVLRTAAAVAGLEVRRVFRELPDGRDELLGWALYDVARWNEPTLWLIDDDRQPASIVC